LRVRCARACPDLPKPRAKPVGFHVRPQLVIRPSLVIPNEVRDLQFPASEPKLQDSSSTKICHPERRSRFAKRSSAAVEEPALSEAEGTPTPPIHSAKHQGILPKTRVERTLLSAAFDFAFPAQIPSGPGPENNVWSETSVNWWSVRRMVVEQLPSRWELQETRPSRFSVPICRMLEETGQGKPAAEDCRADY
jgi:hypothetical protein